MPYSQSFMTFPTLFLTVSASHRGGYGHKPLTPLPSHQLPAESSLPHLPLHLSFPRPPLHWLPTSRHHVPADSASGVERRGGASHHHHPASVHLWGDMKWADYARRAWIISRVTRLRGFKTFNFHANCLRLKERGEGTRDDALYIGTKVI